MAGPYRRGYRRFGPIGRPASACQGQERPTQRSPVSCDGSARVLATRWATSTSASPNDSRCGLSRRRLGGRRAQESHRLPLRPSFAASTLAPRSPRPYVLASSQNHGAPSRGGPLSSCIQDDPPPFAAPTASATEKADERQPLSPPHAHDRGSVAQERAAPAISPSSVVVVASCRPEVMRNANAGGRQGV